MVLLHSEMMEIGTRAPEFGLSDYKGSKFTLSGLSEGKKGLLVVFTCNHCPYAKAAWPILVELSKNYPEVQFVAVNSNDAQEYPEDDVEGMKKMVEGMGVDFPYLVDEDQSVARSYKAVCTPDPYLFNVENDEARLFYHGRINDNWKDPDNVREENLKDAIEGLLAGEDAPSAQPASMGCSIKWKE